MHRLNGQVQEPAFQQELAITIENLSPSRQVNLQQRPAAPPAQESSPLFQAPQQTQESTQHQAVLDSVGRTGVGFDVTASELSVHEHSGAIFTLTHDPLNDSILTTGRDGKMVTWTQSGTVKQTNVLDNYYACSADINVRHQTLLLCGVPRDAIDPGQPSAVCTLCSVLFVFLSELYRECLRHMAGLRTDCARAGYFHVPSCQRIKPLGASW